MRQSPYESGSQESPEVAQTSSTYSVPPPLKTKPTIVPKQETASDPKKSTLLRKGRRQEKDPIADSITDRKTPISSTKKTEGIESHLVRKSSKKTAPKEERTPPPLTDKDLLTNDNDLPSIDTSFDKTVCLKPVQAEKPEAKNNHADLIQLCKKYQYEEMLHWCQQRKNDNPQFRLADILNESDTIARYLASPTTLLKQKVFLIHSLKSIIDCSESITDNTFKEQLALLVSHLSVNHYQQRLLTKAAKAPLSRELLVFDSPTNQHKATASTLKSNLNKGCFLCKEDIEQWLAQELDLVEDPGEMDDSLTKNEQVVLDHQAHLEKSCAESNALYLKETDTTTNAIDLIAPSPPSLFQRLGLSTKACTGVAIANPSTAGISHIDSIHLDETINIGDQHYKITALFNPEGKDGYKVAEFAKKHLKAALERRLNELPESSTKHYNALSLALVDVNHQLAVSAASDRAHILDTAGASATVMLEVPGKLDTELYVANLGDVSTILVDEQGQAEALSAPNADRGIGFYALGEGTSARPVITKKLVKPYNLTSMHCIQCNGAIARKISPYAMTEARHQLGTKTVEEIKKKHAAKAKAFAIPKHAMAVYETSPVSPQQLAEKLVKQATLQAGKEQAVMARVAPLDPQKSSLPEDIITPESICYRLRHLPDARDDKTKHLQAFDRMFQEICSQFPHGTRERKELLDTLCLDVLENHGGLTSLTNLLGSYLISESPLLLSIYHAKSPEALEQLENQHFDNLSESFYTKKKIKLFFQSLSNNHISDNNSKHYEALNKQFKEGLEHRKDGLVDLFHKDVLRRMNFKKSLKGKITFDSEAHKKIQTTNANRKNYKEKSQAFSKACENALIEMANGNKTILTQLSHLVTQDLMIPIQNVFTGFIYDKDKNFMIMPNGYNHCRTHFNQHSNGTITATIDVTLDEFEVYDNEARQRFLIKQPLSITTSVILDPNTSGASTFTPIHLDIATISGVESLAL